MRLAPLLALCLALPLAAQTPDPTPPEAYYPLGIGDVREYRTSGDAMPPTYARERVLGDTLVNGVPYRIVTWEGFRSDGTSTGHSTQAVRFDTALAMPVGPTGAGPEQPLAPCRFDLPFPAPDAPIACESGAVLVGYGPAETVAVGADTLVTAVKAVDGLFGGIAYAAGLGVLWSVGDASDRVSELRYARIAGVAYGTPDPILPPLAPTASDFWPLQIGNGWAYEVTEIGQPTYRRAVEVIGDTLLGGRAYSALRECFRSGSNGWACYPSYVRTDDAAGAILQWTGEGQPEYVIMCGLNAPAGPIDPCSAEGIEMFVYVIPGPNVIGVASQPVTVGEVRGLDGPVDPGWPAWAEGFGQLDYPVWNGWSSITYARIGDQTYGVFPVDADHSPLASDLALTASPNPTAGSLALRVTLLAPAALTVEAFDALGRRVHRVETTGSAGEQVLEVDARGWAPGVYVVRATTGGGEAATVRVVRR